MGKKKKALIRYKRLGTISKKLEKKFSNFLQANIETFTTKVEETLEKVDTLLDKTEEFLSEAKTEVVVETATAPEPVVEEQLIQVEEPVVETKPKTTRKTTSTKKSTTSTARRRRTTKTKTDA